MPDRRSFLARVLGLAALPCLKPSFKEVVRDLRSGTITVSTSDTDTTPIWVKETYVLK